MARSHFRHVVKDQAGNVLQNAKVFVYETGTTTVVADLYDAATGGSAVAAGTLVSNGQGEIEGWLQRPRTVDLKVTDNDNTAHYPADVSVLQDFGDFTETVEVQRNPAHWYDFNVLEYGALADSTTDDRAAIQAACDAAALVQGTVVVPTTLGKYAVGAPGIVLTHAHHGIKITGGGPAAQRTTAGSELLYTADTGSLIDVTATVNFEFYGLAFNYNNPAFTGDVVSIKGSPTHGDVQNFHIKSCSSRYTPSTTGPARSNLYLDRAIFGSVQESQLTSAQWNVYTGASYVNIVTFEKCEFNFSTWPNGAIGLDTADGETITIRDCGFEARGAVDGISGNQLYNFVFENNWCGDASSLAPVTWINNVKDVSTYTCVIANNRFGSPGTTGGNLYLDGNNWTVENNSFDGGAWIFKFDTPSLVKLKAEMNRIPSTVPVFAGTEPGTFYGKGNSNAPDRHAPRLCMPGSADITDHLSDITSTGGLVLGSHSASTLADLGGTRAGVYKGASTHRLILQASGDTTAREVQLVAGLDGAKTPVVRVSDLKVGFYNHAPAAQPAAYTQNYSTADRTLDAYTADSESVAYTGAADGEAKLADLNALRVAYENLRAFVEDLAKFHNSHVDDHQANGLFQ